MMQKIYQIRILQEFLNKTPIIYNHKLAVICDDDLMTINTSNSCLKILEDTAKNTYIFLIVKNPTNLLATIRSKYTIFKPHFTCKYIEDELYNKLSSIFVNIISDHLLDFLKEFTEKNRELLYNVQTHILFLFAKIVKK